MIQTQNSNTIVRHGLVNVEHKFRIKVSGKAFQILTDGLYSDKVAAIIRELSANAYDAHVEAGNIDKPFLIQLPNVLNPNFSIRDYGTGMLPEIIETVYTTIFDSDKEDTNDLIGCMGLGSKTPLCYTDSFVVNSFVDGKKYVYSIFKDEDGCPSYIQLMHGDTDEPNGLEVTFAVKKEDFWEFQSKVHSSLQYFQKKPKIIGGNVNEEDGEEIIVKPVEYILNGEGWGIRSSNCNTTHAQAIMGNIAYPIYNLVRNDIGNSEDEAFMRSFLTSPVDIFFNIGDLDVAPSRESLQINKTTKQNILNRLQLIKNNILCDIQRQLDICPNLYEARKTFKNLCRNMTYVDTLFKYDQKPVWNGQEFSLRISCDDINKVLLDRPAIRKYYLENSRRRHGNLAINRDTPRFINIDDEDRRLFVINDAKHLNNRIKYYFQNNSNTDIYYIIEDDAKVIEEIYKAMGATDIPMTRLSTMPKDPTVGTSGSGSKSTAPRTDIVKLSPKKDIHKESDKWEAVYEVPSGGVYIRIDRFRTLTDITIEDGVRVLKHFGLDAPVIYGLKENAKEKCKDSIVKNNNWIDFKKYILEIIHQQIPDIGEQYAAYLFFNNYDVSRVLEFCKDAPDKFMEFPVFRACRAVSVNNKFIETFKYRVLCHDDVCVKAGQNTSNNLYEKIIQDFTDFMQKYFPFHENVYRRADEKQFDSLYRIIKLQIEDENRTKVETSLDNSTQM